MSSTAAIAENIANYRTKTVAIGRALDPHWFGEAAESFNSNVNIHEALRVNRSPGVLYVDPVELAALAGENHPLTESTSVNQVLMLIGGIATEKAIELPTLEESLTLRLHEIRIRKQKSFILLRAAFFDNDYDLYSPFHIIERERRIIRQELGLCVSRSGGSLTRTPTYVADIGEIRTKEQLEDKRHARSRVTNDVEQKAKFAKVGPLLF